MHKLISSIFPSPSDSFPTSILFLILALCVSFSVRVESFPMLGSGLWASDILQIWFYMIGVIFIETHNLVWIEFKWGSEILRDSFSDEVCSVHQKVLQFRSSPEPLILIKFVFDSFSLWKITVWVVTFCYCQEKTF